MSLIFAIVCGLSSYALYQTGSPLLAIMQALLVIILVFGLGE